MTIEALKQALEALENLQGLCSEEGNFIEQLTIWTPEAIYALRTAIAEAEKQEPVAQIIALGQYEFPGLEWLSADHSFRAPIGTLLYTTPPAAQPAPVQEPRHIVQSNGRHSPLLTHMMNSRTTPPAAQPEQKQDSTCNKTLRAEGKGYPRTCRKCGKGPCIADRVQPEQGQWDAIPDAFNEWWNADYDDSTNPFRLNSPAYWAWSGWSAANKEKNT
jgi:hypothetical protein